MAQFVKRLSTGHGPQNFYFNSLQTAGGMQYHGSVMDPDRKVQSFILEVKNGKWEIANRKDYPPWILEMEPEIIRTIVEEESKY
jgi:hypothetical protein